MTTTSEHCMKKPPRPWSADINHKRKMLLSTPESAKCYTSRSDTTHNKYGRMQEAKLNASFCLTGCRNPPNTPVCCPISTNRVPQLPGRQPLPQTDEGRCIRLRTISHSAPPLNFPSNWNPLIDRHPGSAFDIVSSSAGSSRTCSPEQTASRAEMCPSHPDFEYDNPILKPVPVKRSTCGSVKFYPQISEECVKERFDEEETLPDRLFREQLEAKKKKNNMKPDKLPQKKLNSDAESDGSESDCSLTLPDKLFKAHMAKQALERGCSPSSDVKPKIIGKSGGGSVRNGLKDKFVLNIIESFNDQSNVLKELSNMKLDSNCERKSKKSKKKSFGTLKKTWSSIMNLAVGVPSGSDGLHHAQSKDNISGSKKSHVGSLYTESMYSTLVGDIYKSRSTACIAAL